jgi:S1-C subfamily serine protease
VSRETRLLLIVLLAAVATLWVLARIRFPEQLPTPNPVPPVLAQLAPRATLDDIVAAVAQLQSRLAPSLVAVTVSRSPDASASVLRFRDDLGVGLLPAVRDPEVETTVVGHDPVSQLAVIRVREGDRPPGLQTWSPVRMDAPRFLMAAEVSRQGVSLRPIYVASLTAVESPTWSGPVWRLPREVSAAAGTFLFTTDGQLAGLTADPDGRLVVVPGETLLAAADRIAGEPSITAGWLGLEVQALTPDLAAATGAEVGVVVSWVDPAAPLIEQVQVADVIEAVGDQPVDTLEHWRAFSGRIGEGTPVRLRIRRRGEVHDVQASAVRAPASVDQTPVGLTVRTIPRIGVEVVRVLPGSIAARAGIRPGDIVTHLGDIGAPTAADVPRTFAAAGDRPLTIAFSRGDAHHLTTTGRRP